MRARISPHWRASRGRTDANSSSRRIFRASVSPASRSITWPEPSPSSDSSTKRTPGTGTLAPPARRSSAASVSSRSATLAGVASAEPPGRRRRISGSADAPSASNDQISLLAPPESRWSEPMPGTPASRRRVAAASGAPRSVTRDTGALLDLPQELREPVADAVAAAPLGHALADVRHHAVSPVAQRDEVDHFAAHVELLAA